MKKILLLFVLIVLMLNCNAQRLNEHGLKMVSEVECYFGGHYPKYPYLLKFKYDEKNRLTRMTVYCEGKLYRDFIKDDNGLTIKDYEDNFRYESDIDIDGNIRRLIYYDEYAPNCFRKMEFEFFYERDGIDNTFRLKQYNSTETGKAKGDKSWFGTSCGTHKNHIFYHKGFFMGHYYPQYHDSKYDDKIKQSIDYSFINDTNIDLETFLRGGDKFFGHLALEFLTVSEWLNCRNKYFMSNYTKRAHFEYDDRGNLIMISREDVIPKDVPEIIVNIKYLY